MSNWIDLGQLEQFPNNSAKNQSGVTVFRFDDRFYVTETRCPHMGYPMSKGTIRDGIVTCAWHKWDFDLEHGGCYRGACDDLRIYPYKIDGQHLWVDKSAHPGDVDRWKRQVCESMMQGDRFLLAKTLAQAYQQHVTTQDIERVAQQQAFEHAVRAHQNMQATRETHAIQISAALANTLDQPLAVQALLHGLGMASGPAGMRPAVTPLPHKPTLTQLHERLHYFSRESASLGIERLLLSCDLTQTEIQHILLSCASSKERIYLSEDFIGISICLSQIHETPDAHLRIAAQIAWILGAQRPQATADALDAMAWIENHSTPEPHIEFAPGALSTVLAQNNINQVLGQLAAWLEQSISAEDILNDASALCARRLAKLSLNNGGLWRDAVRGLRLCAAIRRMLDQYHNADPTAWLYQLGYFLFETRWLQEREQDFVQQTKADVVDWDAFPQAYEALDLKAVRAAAFAAYRSDPKRARQLLYQQLIQDDINYEMLAGIDAICYEMQFRDNFEPYLSGLCTYAIDQRNSRNTLAAAQFGNSFK